MAKHFHSNYTRKLLDQDPNGIVELEAHECRTPNDYVPWDDLSSDVRSVKLTPEELDRYLKGELVIEFKYQSPVQESNDV